MTNLSLKQNHSLTSVSDVSYYYKVTIKNQLHGANTRCCGTEKDLQSILELYPGSEWEKVLLPTPPATVDVPYISIKDQELPIQQILPESTSTPLNL